MAKYRKKPVEIQAVQWNGENIKEVLDFSKDAYLGKDDCTLFVETLEGDMKASIGDYIIKGVNGEFYPCKPDIFEKTYSLGSHATYLSGSGPTILSILDGDYDKFSMGMKEYFRENSLKWKCMILQRIALTMQFSMQLVRSWH